MTLAAHALACLVIHTGPAPAAAWRRATRGLKGLLRRDDRALRLQVDDLAGKRVLTIDDAGPRVALALPAGTYQVTARVGELCRCYTITLTAGRSFDLALQALWERL